MYPVSDTFGPAVREAHAAEVRLDAYRGGDLIVENIAIIDGSVTVNSGTGVRRTLDVTITDESYTLAGLRALWEKLDVTGVELKAYRGVQYPNGQTEMVPLGVFSLDTQAVSVSGGSGIQIRSAPDRWARVQRAQFEKPASSMSGQRISAEIARLVAGAVPGGSINNQATSTAMAGLLIWDIDRSAAVVDLATSIGAEVYFDVQGDLVIKDAPLLSQTPVWTVDASPSGVLVSGERSRDRARTYNVVVAYSSSLDGASPYEPVVVVDDDPRSPTYAGGPFGRVPYRYTSPAMTSAAQAKVAATALLNKLKAVNAQLNVEASPHPGLDRGDVITVLTPDGTIERHLIDSVTIPLGGGNQQITTRSSRPDGDIPVGE